MSLRTGWAGRILAGGLAAALSVSLAVPAVASPAPAQAPTVHVSDDTSFTTDLFASLAKGAAGNVGGAAAGWAMSAMGLSSGDSAALASINSDLQTIITQLSDIEKELSQLTAAIQQLDCDTLTADINAARTTIDSSLATYQGFADQGAGTFGPPSVPPVTSMDSWAAAVTDQDNGVLSAVLAISNALLPAGSAQGIITACLQPSIVQPPAVGTIGDTDYYDTVANLVDFYYTYQARGLLMLQEAYHYQAQQATGQTLPPDQVGDVCTTATGSAALHACTQAIDDTNTVYERLALQFQVAGLPYTDDHVLIRNTGGATAPLFVRSLEEFTLAAGDNCPSPLTAADPCGVTVATGATVTDAMHVDFDNYSTWTAATKGQFENLLENRGSAPPGEWMNSLGFKNAADKVLLTPQTASFDLQDDLAGTQICFLYTQRQVFCGNKGVNEDLLEVYSKSKAPFPCPVSPFWRKNGSLPDNVAFFAADTHNKVVDVIGCEWEWSTQPGWLQGNTSSSAEQLRWPHLQVEDLTCTNGRPPTNPGGMPTRCGSDFDALFNTLVERPVTCSGVTFGQCGDTVGIALSGPRLGLWTSPVLKGDLSVTFDGDVVRRIKGRARLPEANGGASARVAFNIKAVGGTKGRAARKSDNPQANRDRSYSGVVRIKSAGHPTVVARLHRAQLTHHDNGIVDGQTTWHQKRRGGRGEFTVTWTLADRGTI